MLTDPSRINSSFLLGRGTPLPGTNNQPSIVVLDQAKITSLEKKLEAMEKGFKLKLELLEQKLENLKQAQY